MKYISLCSGIEAASVAFESLGWEPIAFSEIEPFPCAVLNHHYPKVPNLGDMTKFKEWSDDFFANADVIVGGPPCQAFSVAGLRNGLNDERGNLTLAYAELINHADSIRTRLSLPPTICIYENVPGIFSDKTNAFGCLLGALAGENGALISPGGKWTDAGCVSGPQRAIAWRLLDAQYFGVAQRRRRVFLIASARDGFDPFEILFERQSLRRDNAPSREQREEVTGTITARTGNSRNNHEECVIQPKTLCFDRQSSGEYGEAPVASTMSARDYKSASDLVAQPMAIRRLTPIECERLQGFPDNYTNIPWRKSSESPDGPRYKALGNSMAVPCMQWISQQIKSVEEVLQWNK